MAPTFPPRTCCLTDLHVTASVKIFAVSAGNPNERDGQWRRPEFALGGFLASLARRFLAAFVFLHQLLFALHDVI